MDFTSWATMGPIGGVVTAVVLLVRALITRSAFTLANETYRQAQDADHRLLDDAYMLGGEDGVRVVAEAAAKLAATRGPAPRWHRFQGDEVLPWSRPRAGNR